MHFTLESAFSIGAPIGHAGYVLLIASMLMTRMTWLRIFAIGAGILEATYYIGWLPRRPPREAGARQRDDGGGAADAMT